MTERLETNKDHGKTPDAEGPGILESYGSFPVWMLRLIQLVTPSFLVSKTPPKKKDYRI